MIDEEKVEKSLIVKVSRDVWRRFKAKLDMEEKKIGPTVRGWILDYLKPKKDGAAAPEPGVSRTVRRLHADLETITREEPGAEAEPELPTLEEAGIDFKDVERYAGHLKIDIAGMNHEEAASLILDGVFRDYGMNHEKLSAEEFDEFKSENDDMLQWFNDHKDYGADEEGEEE